MTPCTRKLRPIISTLCGHNQIETFFLKDNLQKKRLWALAAWYKSQFCFCLPFFGEILLDQFLIKINFHLHLKTWCFELKTWSEDHLYSQLYSCLSLQYFHRGQCKCLFLSCLVLFCLVHYCLTDCSLPLVVCHLLLTGYFTHCWCHVLTIVLESFPLLVLQTLLLCRLFYLVEQVQWTKIYLKKRLLPHT